MATLNQVAKGQSDWQVPLNQLINVVNELGGFTAQHIDDAITFVNGASCLTQTVKYIQGVGFKVVSIDIVNLHTSGNNKEIVLQMPSNLAPNVATNVETNTQSEVVIDSTGQGVFYTTDPNASKGEDVMHLHLHYLRFDN